MSATNLALARVLAAMAWSSGQIQAEEKSVLLELFSGLGLDPQELAQVVPLLESPVTIEQFGTFARAFRESTSTPVERHYWLARVESLAAAVPGRLESQDRTLELLRLWVGDEELLVQPAPSASAAAPGSAGESAGTVLPKRLRGFLGDLRRKAAGVSAGMLQGSAAASVAEALRLRVGERVAGAGLDPGRRHYLTLYGALLYRVVRADGIIRPEETSRVRSLLSEGFGFSGSEIEPVLALIETDVAASADRQRLCAEFNRITEMDERLGLLEALFAVSLADGEWTPEEEQEIRLIANFLWIETQEFVRIRRASLGARAAGGAA